MLAELAEYLITPCPPLARRLGYLKESVAIGARGRRLRRAWSGHLENCRTAILEAAGLDGLDGEPGEKQPGTHGGSPVGKHPGSLPGHPGGNIEGTPGGKRADSPDANRPHGTALILGSGSLLDIPLEALARTFDRVVLADLIHPLAARWRVRKLGNVVQDSVDVTGILSGVLDSLTVLGQPQDQTGGRKHAGSTGAGPAGQKAVPPRLPAPALPALYRDLNPDLVVSANILSQLPLFPVKHLAATGDFAPGELEAWSIALKQRHLEWLRTFPGTVLLLTDTAWLDGDREEDALHGLDLPAPFSSWTWDIAPRPEIYPDRDVRHRVGAFLLKRRT